MIATQTVVLTMAMSIMTLAPIAALAQPIPTQTVNAPIVDSYMIPLVNNILTIPGPNSDSCETWTNTDVDNGTKTVTTVQQCHTQNQYTQNQQPQTDPFLTSLLLNLP
jgi:hypothetical protein